MRGAIIGGHESSVDGQVHPTQLRRLGRFLLAVAVGPNMFYTVTLPCTLWFLDRGKAVGDRSGRVLFIDARHIYRQVDRAHRDWSDAQMDFLAAIVKLYRRETIQGDTLSEEAQAKLHACFGCKLKYADVAGLCKVVSVTEVSAQAWSLNPGRYVGVAAGEAVSDEDFNERLGALNEELEALNTQAREFELTISRNVADVLAQ